MIIEIPWSNDNWSNETDSSHLLLSLEVTIRRPVALYGSNYRAFAVSNLLKFVGSFQYSHCTFKLSYFININIKQKQYRSHKDTTISYSHFSIFLACNHPQFFINRRSDNNRLADSNVLRKIPLYAKIEKLPCAWSSFNASTFPTPFLSLHRRPRNKTNEVPDAPMTLPPGSPAPYRSVIVHRSSYRVKISTRCRNSSIIGRGSYSGSN